MNPERELRRVRCLQAMGLVVHVSRRALPGAATTQRLALKRGGPSPAARTAVDPRSALRASLSGTPPAGEAGPHPQGAAGVAIATGQAAPEAAERFSVAAVISGGRLWIEDLGTEALSMEQVQLMVAVGRALSHPECDRSAPRVAQFDWPMHDNPQLDLGPGEARAALHSFLLRQLQEQGCEALMCVGPAAAARIDEADFPVPVQCLPDSRALLEDPAGKRRLWSQLRG
jgi:hypothetical protein